MGQESRPGLPESAARPQSKCRPGLWLYLPCSMFVAALHLLWTQFLNGCRQKLTLSSLPCDSQWEFTSWHWLLQRQQRSVPPPQMDTTVLCNVTMYTCSWIITSTPSLLLYYCGGRHVMVLPTLRKGTVQRCKYQEEGITGTTLAFLPKRVITMLKTPESMVRGNQSKVLEKFTWERGK